jgi:multisubunit Na+/H+ antiporter MnhB subunit
MSMLQRVIKTLGKRARQGLAIIAATVALAALVYRLVFAFAPPWLDLVVVISAGLAFLVLWLLGRNNTFDYSTAVKRPSSAQSNDHEA